MTPREARLVAMRVCEALPQEAFAATGDVAALLDGLSDDELDAVFRVAWVGWSGDGRVLFGWDEMEVVGERPKKVMYLAGRYRLREHLKRGAALIGR